MAGWFDFVNGQTLPASRVQDYLMDQSVMVFADAAARTSALPTPTAGMVTFLSDSGQLFVYKSSAWQPIVDPLTPTPINSFINGSFDFWQRGNSFTGINNAYGADRWVFAKDGGTSINLTRETFTPGTAPVAGYEAQFYARMVTSVAGPNPYYMSQRIEDVRSFAGQTVTLSYWAKASVAVANTPLIVQNFGSGGSSSVVTSSLGTQNLTTSWQRFTTTFTVPSISGKTVGTNSLLEVQVIRASTSATVDVWGAQIQAGPVATPFVRAATTLQGELAACQRYYQVFTGNAVQENIGAGQCYATTNALIHMSFMTTLRAAPTVSFSAATDFKVYAANGAEITLSSIIGAIAPTINTCRIVVEVTAGLVAGNGTAMIAANTNARINVSAEL